MGDVSSVWTSEIKVRWAPNLRYFDGRAKIEQAARENGHLRQIDVRGEALVVLLDDLSIQVDPNSLTVSTSGELPAPQTLDLMRAVDGLLDPDWRQVRVLQQHLLEVPLSLTYDQATTRAAHHWLAVEAIRPEIGDCAVLLDGHVSKLAASYQVEFGLVGPAEIPARIARTTGRPGTQQGKALTAAEPVLPDEPPPLSVFADFNWGAPASGPPRKTPDWAWSLWHGTVAYSTDFVRHLRDAVVGHSSDRREELAK